MSDVADLLRRLVHDTHAARVLEIGTGAAVTTIAMAEAMDAGGRLLTLERDSTVAGRARAIIGAAGHASRVSVIVGDAARYLHKIAGPFDLVVWRADPSDYRMLHDRLVRLLAPGATLALVSDVPMEDYNEVLASDARLTRRTSDAGDRFIVATRRKDT